MREEATTVLVTGVGGASLGEQCLKALRAASTGYRIIATDLVRESLGLSLADVPCVVPPASDEGYLSEMLRLCEEHGVNAMIPTSEAELRVVSGARDRFTERGIFLPINRHELISAGDDKFQSLEKIAGAGVRTPAHLAMRSVGEAAAWSDFPCVVKPAFGGSGSANVFIAQSADELRALAGYLLGFEERVTIEEYVGDAHSEFTVAVLRDMDGGLIHSIAIRRALLGGISNRVKVPNRTGRRELGEVLAISSGVSQGRIDDFPEVRGPCEALAEGLDSRGPLNIQCRMHEGELVVFEINPRFSGTSLLRALAGFNEPDLLIRLHVLGESVERGFRYGHGTVLRGLSEVFYPDSE
jgi:carbamoyl-phosphate synthase large subunit